MSPASSSAPSGFLDAASGQPLNEAGRQALLAALDSGWADPARLYRDARRADLLLHAARESIAAILGCSPEELSFDSSVESAMRRGLTGLARGRSRISTRIVHSAVEHSALLHTIAGLDFGSAAASGGAVSIGVDQLGRVHAEEFIAAARDAGVAVLQSANHEVGTTQPVEQVSSALGEVPLLMDAHQSIGRTELPTGWATLVGGARHWGGPSGVAVLAVKRSARWRSAEEPNDGREFGRVPGVPNVPLIVAAAAALEFAERERTQESARLRVLVDHIRERVANIDDVVVVGDPRERLPHIVTFSCLYVDGEALLGELDREGFAVSSGSACTSDVLTPSHVLVAMDVLSHGNVRVSLPHGVRHEDIEHFLTVLPGAVARVREQLGAQGL